MLRVELSQQGTFCLTQPMNFVFYLHKRAASECNLLDHCVHSRSQPLLQVANVSFELFVL